MLKVKYLVLGGLTLFVAGALLGYGYRDRKAQGFAEKAKRDREFSEVKHRAEVDSIKQLVAQAQAQVDTLVDTARFYHDVVMKVSVPDTTQRDSLRYWKATAEASIKEAGSLSRAVDGLQVIVGRLTAINFRDSVRIDSLQQLRDEGEAVVVSPRRRLLGIIPLPSCGPGVGLVLQKKIEAPVVMFGCVISF